MLSYVKRRLMPRQVEEAKLARKEASRPDPEEEVETPGITSLAKSSVLTSTAPLISTRIPEPSAVDADIPDLVDTELPTLQDVLDRADVICEVVDARDILGGRSKHMEGLVRDSGERVVLLVNKTGVSQLLPVAQAFISA